MTKYTIDRPIESVIHYKHMRFMVPRYYFHQSSEIEASFANITSKLLHFDSRVRIFHNTSLIEVLLDFRP